MTRPAVSLAALFAAIALPMASCAEDAPDGDEAARPAEGADRAEAGSEAEARTGAEDRSRQPGEPDPSDAAEPSGPPPDFDEAVERAAAFESIRTLHIAQNGETAARQAYNGAGLDAAANIKSASKSLVSALVGAAIDRGVLEGPDQPIADILQDAFPDDPDPRLYDITIGDLLSMQAGLERTSGGNYGGWVASANWVEDALSRPFDDEPGGGMLYSTGSSHLLSAILMRETGSDTQELANRWLGPAGVRVSSWTRDPQGVHMGGNETAMTPASLLALGELYRRGGVTEDGDRILSEDWIEQSWTPRTASRFTGDGYGYGWFIREFGGAQGYYGWGYGGQMIYVIPELELTVAITSDPNSPSGRSGYRDDLHRFVSREIVPVAQARLEAARRSES